MKRRSLIVSALATVASLFGLGCASQSTVSPGAMRNSEDYCCCCCCDPGDPNCRPGCCEECPPDCKVQCVPASECCNGAGDCCASQSKSA